MVYSLGEIADKLTGELVGNPDTLIDGIGTLNSAKTKQIVFATQKNIKMLKMCNASAFIIPDTVVQEFEVPVIKVKNPRLSLITLISMFEKQATSTGVIMSESIHISVKVGQNTQIDEYAVLGKHVEIGSNTIISSHTNIRESVVIGDNCVIHPNVTIMKDSVIGDNVTIHSGVVIGADGFGFEWDGTQHVKIPHIGNVVIENDVEIGANTCIDRGTIDSTIIGRGTKIDNLVQIGHNVQVGKYCLIAGTSAIGGSAKLGDHVVMAGGSGVVNNISIGDHTMILARSTVTKNTPPKSVVSGYVARPHKRHLKEAATVSRLPETLKGIHEKIHDLSKTSGGNV